MTYYNGTAGQAPAEPMGAITNVKYGSTVSGNDTDSFTFSVSTNQLTNYTFNVGSQAVSGNLAWNGNGTLQQLQITDPLNANDAQTCNYGYDDLVRIANVNCGASVWNQSFAPWLGQGKGQNYGANYDVFGNLQKAVPTGSTGLSFIPTYDSSTNRFATLPGITPQYDANGNLKYDGTYTNTWNAEGAPVTISNGSTTITYTYDAFGRAVEKYNGSIYQQIVYGPTGKLGIFQGYQTLVRAYVPLPGGGTAVYFPGQLPAYYRHGDWLGTSRLATTPSRTMYSDSAYAPFGENYNGSGTTDLDFTGQEQDTAIGLYDFQFRKYNAVQGRWISPDPAGLGAVDISNPQTWNRYGYVGNSPLTNVDPLGLDDGGPCLNKPGTVCPPAPPGSGDVPPSSAPTIPSAFDYGHTILIPLMRCDDDGCGKPAKFVVKPKKNLPTTCQTGQHCSDAYQRCINGQLISATWAGIVGGVDSVEQEVVELANTVRESEAGLVAALSTTAGSYYALSATGAATVGAAAEVAIPVVIVGGAGYMVYQGGKTASDYMNQNASKCDNL